mgnify:FL=1
MDNPPVASLYKEVNLTNHLQAIKFANLGPADPRQPEVDFWTDKMIRWKVQEGEARSRLCMNCEEYDDSPEVVSAFKSGEGGTLLASDVDPTWADIPGLPTGNCLRWSISCASLRTCDDWEPIGEEEMPEMDE